MKCYKGKDIPGYDICQIQNTRDPNELFKICQSIPSAKGFNSNGWIKRQALQSELKDEGSDFYIIGEEVGKNDYYKFFHDDLNKNLENSDITTFKSWDCVGRKGLWIYVPDDHIAAADYEKNLVAALDRFNISHLKDPLPNSYTKKNGTDAVICRHAGDFARANIDLTKVKHIFEVGAGYGALANVLLESGYTGTYTIFDFKNMEKIQRCYIKGNFDFVHDPSQITYKKDTLLISTWGISEMPSELATTIVKTLKPDYFYVIAQNIYDSRNNIDFFTDLFGFVPDVYDEHSSKFFSF